MIHNMRLLPEYFDKIASGEKTVEYRINDLKRQKIKVGDILRFFKITYSDEYIEYIVRKVVIYSSFKQMLENEEKVEDCSMLLAKLESIYNKEDEANLGVIAIYINKE